MSKETEEVIVAEDIDFGALFEGEVSLTEEFKEKAKTIFEAAVSVKTKEKVEAISEELAEKFDTELESIRGELVEKIDEFLNYVVEQWVADNQLAIEHGVKTEIMENFVEGLKNLFTESYIDVPEEKRDLVSEMEEKLVEMENKLNEQVQKNIELSSKVSSLVKESVISEVSKELTESEIEKFKGLVEDVDFEDETSYKEKLSVIKENYFPKHKSASASNISEGVEEGEEVVIPPTISRYLEALNRVK